MTAYGSTIEGQMKTLGFSDDAVYTYGVNILLTLCLQMVWHRRHNTMRTNDDFVVHKSHLNHIFYKNTYFKASVRAFIMEFLLYCIFPNVCWLMYGELDEET